MTRVQQSFVRGFVKAAAEAFNLIGMKPQPPANLTPKSSVFSSLTSKNSPSIQGDIFSKIHTPSPVAKPKGVETYSAHVLPFDLTKIPNREYISTLPNAIARRYSTTEMAYNAYNEADKYRRSSLNKTLPLQDYNKSLELWSAPYMPPSASHAIRGPKPEIHLGTGWPLSGGVSIESDFDYNIPQRYAWAEHSAVDPEFKQDRPIDVYTHELGHILNEPAPDFENNPIYSPQESNRRLIYAATPDEALTNLANLQRDLTVQGKRVETPWEAEALLRKYLLPQNRIPVNIKTKTDLIDFMRTRSEIQALPRETQRWMNDIQDMIRVGGNNDAYATQAISDGANAFPGLL